MPRSAPAALLSSPRIPAPLVSRRRPGFHLRVLEDPEPVEAAADGSALICCARPRGGVVLAR